MRKVPGFLVFFLILVSCVYSDENSAEVEEPERTSTEVEVFESKDMIGTWVKIEPLKGDDNIIANIIRFRLFQDSTAELLYGESEEIKEGKWKMNPKMEAGNKMFGMSFEADLMLTFQSSESTLANIVFNVGEKSGNLILKAGAKSPVYQKEE